VEAKVRWQKSIRSLLRGLAALCVLCATVTLPHAAPLKYTEDRVPSSLNPIYADDMYSVRAAELIFDRLIGWDKEQKPAPALAISWKIADDKKSITLKLREGVKWHDGEPFTAKDVDFTLKMMTSRSSQIADRYLAQIIQKVSLLGTHELSITFKKELSNPLRWLQLSIIPAHRFKSGTVTRSDYFGQKPVGTGPFVFTNWVGRKINLKRNTQHWGAKSKLIGVSLQAIADKNIQSEVLRYGGIDAIIRVRPKDLPTFERDQNIRLYPYSTNDWWYLGLNNKGLFRDKRLREAFVYALDRDALRSAHLGDGQVISGPFSPNDPLYNFSVTPRPQDTEKAAKLLDEAGWKLAGDVRKKAGKPLKARLLVPKSKESYRPLLLAIQSELRKVGIVVDLVTLNDAAWTREVFTNKNFDMTLHIWNFDDLSTIYPLFHSNGSRNYISYRNKEVDKLLTSANKTTDPIIYKAIYGKLHKLLHEEAPYIFLWSLTNYSSIASRVKQVNIHPFNYFHYVPTWYKQKGD
jgi:peptide/nickel transport system substrate-binding protein